MLKIDNSLLVEIGLDSLPEVEKNSFLKHIYETLEMRVGVRLADQMSNEQLDEFERYFEAKDDAGAFKWLETNFPNYKDIVQQEFDKLKGEVAQSAPQILSASQAAAAAQQAPMASYQTPLSQVPQQPADPYAPPAPPVAPLPPLPPQQPQYQPQQPAAPTATSQSYDPPPTQPLPQAYPDPSQQPYADPAQQYQPQYPPQQPPAGPPPQP